MAARKHFIYQLKVTLKYIRPPIWRRIIVSSSMPLVDLHNTIQIAMGWTNSHLHHFLVDGMRYGVPDPDFDDGMVDDSGVCIGELLDSEKQSLIYEYDFGDGWLHNIVLEKIIPTDFPHFTPKCSAGRRGCPPEDSGGPPMYGEFLMAYNDPAHLEHQDMREWAGDQFDPEKCNLEEINEMLALGPDEVFVEWD